MIRLLIFITSVFCLSFSAIADVLEDASKFTVRVRTSIEHSFAEDKAGTGKAAGFLVDVDNRYLVTNAHVAVYVVSPFGTISTNILILLQKLAWPAKPSLGREHQLNRVDLWRNLGAGMTQLIFWKYRFAIFSSGENLIRLGCLLLVVRG